MSSIRADIERVIEELRGNPIEVSAYFFAMKTGHSEEEVLDVISQLCQEGVLVQDRKQTFDTYRVI